MPEFKLSRGTNFRTQAPSPITEICRALKAVAIFLQDLESSGPLRRNDDWLEHDGLRIGVGTTSIAELFASISSPRDIYGATAQEDFVHVGFGISELAHATSVAQTADGVVVASALVRHTEENASKGGFADSVKALARGLSDGAHSRTAQ